MAHQTLKGVAHAIHMQSGQIDSVVVEVLLIVFMRLN